MSWMLQHPELGCHSCHSLSKPSHTCVTDGDDALAAALSDLCVIIRKWEGVVLRFVVSGQTVVM